MMIAETVVQSSEARGHLTIKRQGDRWLVRWVDEGGQRLCAVPAEVLLSRARLARAALEQTGVMLPTWATRDHEMIIRAGLDRGARGGTVA